MKGLIYLMNEEIVKRLKNTKVLKSYTYNSFKITVRQEQLSEQDRKIADSYMRKQFLEYT